MPSRGSVQVEQQRGRGTPLKSDGLMIEVSLTERELLRHAASALDGSGSSNKLLLRTGVHSATALVVGAQLESRFGLTLDASYRKAIVRELKREVPRFLTGQLGELKAEQEVPRFTTDELLAHGGGTVEPEEVVRRLNCKPVLLRNSAGESTLHQLSVDYSPSLFGRRGFKQLCEDCRRRYGLGNVAVVVVKCPSLDGRHAVAAFKVSGEQFQTVHAENSLGDAFYVTEQNYVRHLTLDVGVVATFDADGVSSELSPPELLSYVKILERNRRLIEDALGGLGEKLRQRKLALEEQREAQAAAAAARQAWQMKRFVGSNIARRQNLLRNIIDGAGGVPSGIHPVPPPVPASLHRIVEKLPVSRSSLRLGLGRSGYESVSFSKSEPDVAVGRSFR